MRLSHCQACPALYLPPAQVAITISTHQLVSEFIPDDGRDHMGLPFKGAHALPVAGLPEKQFPAASATTPTGQPGAVGTPGHRRDLGTVLLERLEPGPIGGEPQTDDPVIPTTCQTGAIRAPRHAPDKGRMCTPDPTATSCGRIPHLHPMHKAAT